MAIPSPTIISINVFIQNMGNFAILVWLISWLLTLMESSLPQNLWVSLHAFLKFHKLSNFATQLFHPLFHKNFPPNMFIPPPSIIDSMIIFHPIRLFHPLRLLILQEISIQYAYSIPFLY